MNKDKVELAWANRVKVIRTAIRLRHAIDADNELNEVLAAEKRRFDRAVHNGKLPPALDPKVLHGEY